MLSTTAVLLSASLALVHARVVELSSGNVIPDATVTIRDGRIESVSPTAGIPPGFDVIDLDGKYLVAGLIDVHSHVATSRDAERALRSGVTTLRILGNDHFVDVGLRELRKRGAIEAPEIFAAGYYVGPGPGSGGVGEPSEALFLDAPELADLMTGIHGPESYRRVTAVNLKHGVDWIKVTATARAGLPETDPREPLMTAEELRAVVEEAGRSGIRVAAHAHGDEGAFSSVEAGVSSIEHGTYLSDRTLRLMREKGVYLVPTLATVRDIATPGGNYDDPFLQVRGRSMLPRVCGVVRMAHELGVAITTGTDTGFEPRSTIRLQDEIEELTHCGLSNLEAIRAATVTASELLGISNRTGDLRAGLEADLIAVDENPLEDISALQDVLLVMSDGRVILDRLRFAVP
jgi:imidazolonepropionase-like amidohydrolase